MSSKSDKIKETILGSSTRPKATPRSQQRKHTRAKIIAAAEIEFKETRFHYTTVDDIASRANVGRATFYTHFRGKEEVLLEIIIQKHATKAQSFFPLLEIKNIDETSIIQWLTKSIYHRFEVDRDWLFCYYIVSDLYMNMTNFFSDGRNEIIDMLGKRFDAFNTFRPDGTEDQAVRSRGHLELYKIEQFALHSVFPGLPLPLDTFKAETARAFLAFLQSAPMHPPLSQDI